MSDYERPEGAVSTGAVVGGVLLGLLLAFAYMVVAFFVSYGLDPEGDGSGIVPVLLLVAPALVGVLLLSFPQTRRSGAGFVMGLAIGLIVLPGVCTLPLLGG
jgi:hypothetical protein